MNSLICIPDHSAIKRPTYLPERVPERPSLAQNYFVVCIGKNTYKKQLLYKRKSGMGVNVTCRQCVIEIGSRKSTEILLVRNNHGFSFPDGMRYLQRVLIDSKSNKNWNNNVSRNASNIYCRLQKTFLR